MLATSSFTSPVLEGILLSQLVFILCFSFSLYGKYCFVRNKVHVKMPSLLALASVFISFSVSINPICIALKRILIICSSI